MKSMLLMFALLCSGLVHAALEVGTYDGVDNARNDYELHIRELPERRGSFIGLLVNNKQSKVRAYLVDAFSSSKYGLLSLRLTGNYNIGVSNTLPSISLTATSDTLVLTPNGENDMGFSTSITFKTKSKKPLRWSPLIAGNYSSKQIVVSNLDAENEATMTSKAAGLVGDYVLRETRQDMYVVLSTQLTSTGVKLDKNATLFAVFMKGGRFGGDQLFIVNSATGAAARTGN